MKIKVVDAKIRNCAVGLNGRQLGDAPHLRHSPTSKPSGT